MIFAPIVLFVYNRPEHTRRTVEALQENIGATESDLIIYSDGPKPGSEEKVAQVREYIKTVDGFNSVTIIEREKNIGLADSIVFGVTETIKKYGKVIVSEDDLVTSRDYLKYMNDALDRYANVSEVMHVSGYMFSINDKSLPETFFLRQSFCWGWATWDRAWKHFHRDADRYVAALSEAEVQLFNLNGAYDYWSQLLANRSGALKTWAIYWYACVFSRGGLCLSPRRTLVQNIGFDGSGENCGVDKQPIPACEIEPIRRFPDVVAENLRARDAIIDILFVEKKLLKKDPVHKKNVLFRLFNRIIRSCQ